jgi:PST family polysaccharide transporter
LEVLFGATNPAELKQKAIRGAAVGVFARGVTFVLQSGSLIVLARLLTPADFGLQAMVVSLTGLVELFRDGGLGFVTVQRRGLTHEQASTLFWINLIIGVILSGITCSMAPFLAAFYREPRLQSVTIAMATTFLFNNLALQHCALLNRAMKFVTLAKVNILALATSLLVGIVMAATGNGYWSLVGLAVTNPIVTVVAVWTAMPWVPGKPARTPEVWSMLHAGGTVTLNSLVGYLGSNTEKILLGRFWGPQVIGLYGRAFQLVNLPVQQLSSSLSTVALPGLSRLQADPDRLRRSFLKGYLAFISLLMPVAISSAIFAEEIVSIVLGPRWGGAALILRSLSPTVLAFALTNPLTWFLQASGRIQRSLNIAFLTAPVMIAGIIAGLHYGPLGVAIAYSTAMLLLIVPTIIWAKHGTELSTSDCWNCFKQPLVAAFVGGALGCLFKLFCKGALNPIPVLILGLGLTIGVYAWFLFTVMAQRALFLDLLNQLRHRTPPTGQGSRHDHVI